MKPITKEELRIRSKLLKPTYRGCNINFYSLWRQKHDNYVNKCFYFRNKKEVVDDE